MTRRDSDRLAERCLAKSDVIIRRQPMGVRRMGPSLNSASIFFCWKKRNKKKHRRDFRRMAARYRPQPMSVGETGALPSRPFGLKTKDDRATDRQQQWPSISTGSAGSPFQFRLRKQPYFIVNPAGLSHRQRRRRHSIPFFIRPTNERERREEEKEMKREREREREREGLALWSVTAG